MPDQPPLDVQPDHLAIVREVLQKHVPELAVWVFGSRVTGKAKPFSDMDLAIIGDAPLSIGTLAALSEAFSDSDLPWKVDIVDGVSISDNFRRRIEERYVVIQKAGARNSGVDALYV